MELQTRHIQALETFQDAGGTLRTREALGAGIHPRDLYALRDSGKLEQISRGVYRLASLPELSEPDLVTVALRVPKAVITLIYALHFHDLTSETPHAVSIALPRRTAPPRLDWPPLEVHRYSGERFSHGVETHQIDGVEIRVYSPAKTIADCFRFRRQVSTEVAVEGLREALAENKTTPAEVMRAAKVWGVGSVVRPYLEAIL